MKPEKFVVFLCLKMNCNNKANSGVYPWMDDRKQCKCLVCRKYFWLNSPDSMDNRVPNCSLCNPSTKEIKYRFDNYFGWLNDYNEDKCSLCGKKIFYRSVYNIFRRCSKCNPSDEHNKYTFDEDMGTYVLSKIYFYDNYKRKHTWKKPAYNDTQKQHVCSHCENEDKRAKEKESYVSIRHILIPKKIVLSSKDSDKKIIVSPDIYVSVQKILEVYHGITTRVGDIIVSYIAPMEFSGSILTRMNLPLCRYQNCVFTGSDFRAANLAGGDFSNSIFDKCDFTNALLTNCNFTGASFKNANMNGADLNGSKLEGAIFSDTLLIYTRIINCIISNVTFKGSNMTKTRLKDCKFSECDFFGVDLSECRIRRSSFTKCLLEDTSFSGKDLSGVDFSYSNLTHTQFGSCDLKEANFRGCKILATRFDKADATNADFTETDINTADMRKGIFVGAIFNDTIEFIHVKVDGADFFGASFKRKFILPQIVFKKALRSPYDKLD